MFQNKWKQGGVVLPPEVEIGVNEGGEVVHPLHIETKVNKGRRGTSFILALISRWRRAQSCPSSWRQNRGVPHAFDSLAVVR